MPSSAYDWVVRFAEELGTEPPDTAEFNALLGLSSVAARASERKAAPVACWVAGRAGVAPAAAIAVARRLIEEVPDEERSADDEPAADELPADDEPPPGQRP